MLPSACNDSVGALIAPFRSSIPSPPIPLFMLRRAPRGPQRKTRGRADRYSFLVRLSHSLLRAGLSRRSVTRLQRYLPASPPPQTARPDSRELPVDRYAITAGASRVASGPLCLHAVATTPAGPMGLFARSPSTSAFPRSVAGRLLHYTFRGLRRVHFRYGLQTRQVTNVTLYTRGFSSFVTSTTAPIGTGRSEPVPGWDAPAVDQRLFTARTNPF
jgi:hypothetical protein